MAAGEHLGPGGWPLAERHLRMIVTMIAVLAAGATVAMWSIGGPPSCDPAAGPGRYGYTWSLVLFLFPLLALYGWYRGHRLRFPDDRKAFRGTLLVLVSLWSALDVFLANRLFRFPSPTANLQFLLPGWVPGEGFRLSIPLEEFLFYVGAVLVIVMLYLWASSVWYERYSQPRSRYVELARKTQPLLSVHWRWLALLSALLAAVIAYKKLGSHDHHEGLPIYAMMLWGLASLPTVLFVRRLSPFLNDRALLFTIMATLLVSLLWEVTLALPYGWWNYHPEPMMGVHIAPWSNLPLEAALLWPIAGWSNVLLFELFRVKATSGRGWLELLFGMGPPRRAPATAAAAPPSP